ncbi:hypothetical protein PGH07_07900 [Sulfurovum sp. zt1-1]|uniref:Uncharacterized protein n=1 Tax=Sulfurovum zhangzhouensis TaxID=3019067 RepID=A0ABT7QZ20_9BACT|nr:hypothetical protein [Sulfurovum zhangzhouensis]MDM5272100.1 hypothetical protein [Sulfurovum zhangzhouensis]
MSRVEQLAAMLLIIMIALGLWIGVDSEQEAYKQAENSITIKS